MIIFDNVSKVYFKYIDDAKRKSLFRILGFKVKNDNQSEGSSCSIKEMSFFIQPGTSLTIVGAPHSGKTTIAKLICGLTEPTSGSVKVLGKSRLVNCRRVGGTPFMKLKTYVCLLLAIFGEDAGNFESASAKILTDCEMLDKAEAKLRDLPDNFIKKIIFYTSIFVDSDIYLFDMPIKFEDEQFASRCKERIDEIRKKSVTIFFSRKLKSVQDCPGNVMVIDKGSLLYFGNFEAAQSLCEKLHLTLPQGNFLQEKIGNSGEKKYTKNMHNSYFSETEASFLESCIKKIEEQTKNRKPIVMGPYLSDVGMELIYWIPFLRWLIGKYNLDKKDILIISRCGAGVWYQEFGVKYIDTCDLVSVQEFSLMQSERIASGMKQFSFTESEQHLINLAVEQAGITDYNLIHPSLMFNLLRLFWKQKISVETLNEFMTTSPINIPQNINDIKLPNNYIAVNFISNPCFPKNSANQFFLTELLDKLTKRYKVININTGLRIDGNIDFGGIADGSRVYDLARLGLSATYKNMLELQTSLISKADFFMGSQSGINYLPPLLRTKTINFYSDKYAGTYPDNNSFFHSNINSFCRNYFTLSDILNLQQNDIFAMIDKLS